MMKHPITVKHKTYRKVNPLPIGVWVIILLFLIFGYFLGGVIAAFGDKEEKEKTEHYFKEKTNDLPA